MKTLTKERREWLKAHITGEGAEQTTTLDKAIDDWIAIEDEITASKKRKVEERKKHHVDLAVDFNHQYEITTLLGPIRHINY